MVSQGFKKCETFKYLQFGINMGGSVIQRGSLQNIRSCSDGCYNFRVSLRSCCLRVRPFCMKRQRTFLRFYAADAI